MNYYGFRDYDSGRDLTAEQIADVEEIAHQGGDTRDIVVLALIRELRRLKSSALT